MRPIIHLFSAHSPIIREQRLVCFAEPAGEKKEIPQTDSAEKQDLPDAMKPANASLEAPADKRLDESKTELEERTAKLKAAENAVKKARAEQPADAEMPVNIDADTLSGKLDGITEANRKLYFALQKDPTLYNFLQWTEAVDAESALMEKYSQVWNVKGQEKLKAKVIDRKKAIEMAKTISLKTHQGVKKSGEKIDKEDSMLSRKEKREQKAYMIGGEFAVEMLKYSKVTNWAYQRYRIFPDEDTQKAMTDAGKVEEQFILANQDKWRDGNDSIKERNAMNRLATITDIKGMNWQRRLENLNWETREKNEREKANETYEKDLNGLLAEAGQSGCPIESKVTDFVAKAIDLMHNTRDAWKKCDDPIAKSADLQMTSLKAARATQAVEQGFIETSYTMWNNSIVEGVIRNRHIQLGGKDVLNRNYKDDLRNVRTGDAPTRNDSIREWLNFQDKINSNPEGKSTKRFVNKQGDPRPIHLSDLSAADSSAYLTWETYGRGKITQEKFDEVYFGSAAKILDKGPQRLKDSIMPVINDALVQAMIMLLPAPEQTPVTGVSVSAQRILESWNAVSSALKSEQPIWKYNFQKMFLDELNRRMPDRVCAVKATLDPDVYTFTLRDDDGVLRMYGIENGTLKNLNRGQQVPSKNPEQKPAAEVAETIKNGPLNIRTLNIGPATLNRPTNAVLHGGGVGILEDIDAPPAGPSRNGGNARNRAEPSLTPEQAVDAAENILLAIGDDGRGWDKLTKEERNDRIADAMQKTGVTVKDDGTAELPEDPKKVKENKAEGSRLKTQSKAQKEYAGTSEANKSKKEADIMMQCGGSVDKDGNVTIPKNTTEALMNRVGGVAMKVMEFFGQLGEMWNKAFGKVTGAPAVTPAATPASSLDSKIKDKTEFLQKAALLEKTSGDAKVDPVTYKLALGEEQRFLLKPEHTYYLDGATKNRLSKIDAELKTIDSVKKGDEERARVVSLLKDKAPRKWFKESRETGEYKQLEEDVFIRREHGKIYILQQDGTWSGAAEAAKITNPKEAIKYEEMLAAMGESGQIWVAIPSGADGYTYSYKGMDPYRMIAKTYESDEKFSDPTTKEYKPEKGWEKI